MMVVVANGIYFPPPPQTPNFNVDSVRVNAAVVLTRLFNIEIGGQGNGSGGGNKFRLRYMGPSRLSCKHVTASSREPPTTPS